VEIINGEVQKACDNVCTHEWNLHKVHKVSDVSDVNMLVSSTQYTRKGGKYLLEIFRFSFHWRLTSWVVKVTKQK
jgi:hypothetical protein